MESYEKGVQPVDVASLSVHACALSHPSPRDEYDALVASIKNGSVSEPILVSSNDGRMEVIDGCLRLEAAKEAGLFKLPAIVLFDVEPSEAEALREFGNTFSHPHTPLQRVDAVGSMRERMDEILSRNPKLYGKRRTTPFNRYLALIAHMSVHMIIDCTAIYSGLVDELRPLVEKGLLPICHALAASDMPACVQRNIAEYIKRNGISTKAGVVKAVYAREDIPSEVERVGQEFKAILVTRQKLSDPLTPGEMEILREISQEVFNTLANNRP